MTSALEGGGGGGANIGLSKAECREDRELVDELTDLDDDRYSFLSPTVVLCREADCGLPAECCRINDCL